MSDTRLRSIALRAPEQRARHLAASACLLAIGALAAHQAHAQSSLSAGGSSYLELKGGPNEFKADCGNLYRCDKKSTQYGVSFGQQVSPNYGYEVGYTDFGSMSRGGGDTQAQGVNLSVVGRIPLDRLAVFAKVGATYARTQTDTALISDIRGGNAYGWGANYGAGVSLDVTEGISVVGQWEETRLKLADDRDARVHGVNVGVRFKY